MMKSLLGSLAGDEQGQDLVEYALLMGILAVVTSVFIQAIGQKISQIFTNATNPIP